MIGNFPLPYTRRALAYLLADLPTLTDISERGKPAYCCTSSANILPHADLSARARQGADLVRVTYADGGMRVDGGLSHGEDGNRSFKRDGIRALPVEWKQVDLDMVAVRVRRVKMGLRNLRRRNAHQRMI